MERMRTVCGLLGSKSCTPIPRVNQLQDVVTNIGTTQRAGLMWQAATAPMESLGAMADWHCRES
eukprot:189344-Amphidinium_carterae.1